MAQYSCIPPALPGAELSGAFSAAYSRKLMSYGQKADMDVTFSTDIISLRETVARRASIYVEPHITCKTIARRASIKKNNLKCPHLKRLTPLFKKSIIFVAANGKNIIMDYTGKYSGLAIADYLIEKANRDGKKITNLSLLKMIFFAQGYGFPDLKMMLIRDNFYAWSFGPVEPKTYAEFKKYGSSNIIMPSGKTIQELDDIKRYPERVQFLDKIAELADVRPYVLMARTHEPGSPWDRTKLWDRIPPEFIYQYYTR
jgi:uncharacterized phage-associated protein